MTVFIAFVLEEKERYLVDPHSSLLGVYETEEDAEDEVYNYLIEHYDYEDVNTVAEDFSDCYNIEKVTVGETYL
jgi:hypothetical protein